MPSVPLELGKYVTVRPPFSRPPRKDGTRRVFFQVPARLAPSDWPSLIPLPIQRPDAPARRGDLADAAEVVAIQADAAALFGKLTLARTRGTAVAEIRRDLPALNRLWQATTEFKQKRPRTQKGYAYHAGLIEAWSSLLKPAHPDVTTIGRERIDKLLAAYDYSPTTRRHVKIVLKMMLDHAERIDWISKNPAAAIKVQAPKSKLRLWELEDVERYAAAAVWYGQPALGALIWTEWEIGQRLTDVRLFRRSDRANSPAEYDARPTQEGGGVFRFWQSKTESYVTIPVSQAHRARLDEVAVPGSPYLFVDARTGAPFPESDLGHLFLALKAQLGEDFKKDDAGGQEGGRRLALTLRALRHACVVQLARAGCTIPEIAAITGHGVDRVAAILDTYLPRDNAVAWAAQAKRGLVEARA